MLIKDIKQKRGKSILIDSIVDGIIGLDRAIHHRDDQNGKSND